MTSANEFFFPPAFTGPEGVALWEQFSHHAVGPVTTRKVKRIRYKSNGEVFTSEVGKVENDGEMNGVVWGIYEPAEPGTPWSVVFGFPTESGVSVRNPPIMVSRSNLIEIVDFEEVISSDNH